MIETPKTVEDCLSLLTGIVIPKPLFPKEQDFGLVIKSSDASILKSIAKQLSKGVAMTDRQLDLVKRKLVDHRQEFKRNSIDLDSCLDNLKMPIREIDRSHWLRILTYKDEDWLAIRFPFSKKIIDRINELQALQSIPAHQKPPYKNHTHCFAFTPKNVFSLVEIAKKFDTKFIINKEITNIYNELLEYESKKDSYIPGVYNLNLANLPEEACKYLKEDVGELDTETLCLYYDRRHLYGLKHFDKVIVKESMRPKTALTKKIIKRESGSVVVPAKNYKFAELIQSVFELKRFPLVLVIDPKKAFEHLQTTHEVFKNYFSNKEMSVLFRVDNKTDPFNKYIWKNKLNNPVAKNTKIVYINYNKLPKPLLRADFVPKMILSYGGKGLNFNNVTQYAQQFDLQAVYEDATTSTYWNKTERKLVHGIM